ncbi:hypothetical protein ACQR3P_30735 [Rhodococcus sp. IEGM1300]
MPSTAIVFFLSALPFLSFQAYATTIHRCEAADGGVTFTTLSCMAGERLIPQEVHAFNPVSRFALMPEAERHKPPRIEIKRSQRYEIEVDEH